MSTTLPTSPTSSFAIFPPKKDFDRVVLMARPFAGRLCPLQKTLFAIKRNILLKNNQHQRTFAMPQELTMPEFKEMLTRKDDYFIGVKDDGVRKLFLYIWGYGYVIGRHKNDTWQEVLQPQSRKDPFLEYEDSAGAPNTGGIFCVLLDVELVDLVKGCSAVFNQERTEICRAYDCLSINDVVLIQQPYVKRKKALEYVVKILRGDKDTYDGKADSDVISKIAESYATIRSLLFAKKFYTMDEFTHKLLPLISFNTTENGINLQNISIDNEKEVQSDHLYQTISSPSYNPSSDHSKAPDSPSYMYIHSPSYNTSSDASKAPDSPSYLPIQSPSYIPSSDASKAPDSPSYMHNSSPKHKNKNYENSKKTTFNGICLGTNGQEDNEDEDIDGDSNSLKTSSVKTPKNNKNASTRSPSKSSTPQRVSFLKQPLVVNPKQKTEKPRTMNYSKEGRLVKTSSSSTTSAMDLTASNNYNTSTVPSVILDAFYLDQESGASISIDGLVFLNKNSSYYQPLSVRKYKWLPTFDMRILGASHGNALLAGSFPFDNASGRFLARPHYAICDSIKVEPPIAELVSSVYTIQDKEAQFSTKKKQRVLRNQIDRSNTKAEECWFPPSKDNNAWPAKTQRLQDICTLSGYWSFQEAKWIIEEMHIPLYYTKSSGRQNTCVSLLRKYNIRLAYAPHSLSTAKYVFDHIKQQSQKSTSKHSRTTIEGSHSMYGQGGKVNFGITGVSTKENIIGIAYTYNYTPCPLYKPDVRDSYMHKPPTSLKKIKNDITLEIPFLSLPYYDGDKKNITSDTRTDLLINMTSNANTHDQEDEDLYEQDTIQKKTAGDAFITTKKHKQSSATYQDWAAPEYAYLTIKEDEVTTLEGSFTKSTGSIAELSTDPNTNLLRFHHLRSKHKTISNFHTTLLKTWQSIYSSFNMRELTTLIEKT